MIAQSEARFKMTMCVISRVFLALCPKKSKHTVGITISTVSILKADSQLVYLCIPTEEAKQPLLWGYNIPVQRGLLVSN